MNSNGVCIIMLSLFSLISVVYLIIEIKKNGLRATVVQMIVRAEELLGSGNGQAKMDVVVDALTAILPTPIRVFVTRELLQKFIQTIFDEVKISLDYQKK